MRRLHLVELHELPGCPDVVRRLATDYLDTLCRLFRPFTPLVPHLARLVRSTAATRVIDLCSGGGAPPVLLAADLKRAEGLVVEVVLTDLYPNLPGFERAAQSSEVRVRGEPEPVDVRRVPAHLTGVRTLFDSFHHFREADARAILADAARSGSPLLIAEGTERSIRGVLSLVLVAPLLTLLVTPLVRPFTWWRILLTYLIPVAPLVILFDGVVSCLRTYTPRELEEMTRSLGDGYRWEVGQIRERGQCLTYVAGAPER